MSSGDVRPLFEAAVGGYARGALILALALLLARFARRRSPAERHRVLALGLWLALFVPFLPRVPLAVLPEETPAAPEAHTLELALLALAALGAALLLLRRLRSALDLARFERASRPLEEPLWRALNAALARAAGLRRAPLLLVHELAHGPATWGFRRARIVLPAEALNWSGPRRRAVLLHELAHVRRRDVLVQLGAECARALHWLDPLAWIALRELGLERERACDDAVLRAGARPSGYAAFLLAFARRLAHSRRRLAAQAMALFGRGPSRPELDARLEHLLDPEQPMQQRHPRAGLPTALLGLLALPIATLELAAASPRPALVAPLTALAPAAAAAPLTSAADEDEPLLEVHELTVRKQGDEYLDLPNALLRAICPTLSQAWLRDVLRAAEQSPAGLPSASDLSGIPGIDGAELAQRIQEEIQRLLDGLGLESPAGIHRQVLRLDAGTQRSPGPPRAPKAKADKPVQVATNKAPLPKTLAPTPVPRDEPAPEAAPPAPSRRELALPRIELLARTRANSVGPDGRACWTPGANYNFLFETSSVEAVLGNFDVEFSNWNGTPALRVELCVDDRSTIAELGQLDISKLGRSQKSLARHAPSPTHEVVPRLGHAYLIRTRDPHLDHWTAVRVLGLSEERITLAYRVLVGDSHPSPGFPRPPKKKRR